MDASTETDVLIAGAGPVGLFLANECARRSLRFVIVEQHSGQSEHSKALAIFPRTFEIFDMAGIVAPFLERANRATSVGVIVHGRDLAHLPFAPADTPYPFVAMVPQDVTERLLAETLARRGGAIRYDTTLVSAVERDGAVDAIVEQRGQQAGLRASFLVGCDGAHSAVRHLLGLPFAGAQYQLTFMLADVETHTALPANELQLCPHERGPLAIFPIGETRRRIVATVDAAAGDAPTLEAVNALLRERGPRGIEAESLHWSSYFGVHHRQVAQLRAGRIFLAGDAAHIHSPFGGQGMNTGLGDAWNLAWKLDLAIRGSARPELLASYSVERRPVIRSVIRTTDRITKVMGAEGRVAQAIRDLAIPMVARLPLFQRTFVRRLSQLGISYHGSPIVQGAGKRYLDASLRRGGVGRRFLLLLGGNVPAAADQEARRLADDWKDILELRPGGRQGILLIRPDGYTAYDSWTATPRTLRVVRELLDRQAINGPSAAVRASGEETRAAA